MSNILFENNRDIDKLNDRPLTGGEMVQIIEQIISSIGRLGKPNNDFEKTILDDIKTMKNEKNAIHGNDYQIHGDLWNNFLDDLNEFLLFISVVCP